MIVSNVVVDIQVGSNPTIGSMRQDRSRIYARRAKKEIIQMIKVVVGGRPVSVSNCGADMALDRVLCLAGVSIPLEAGKDVWLSGEKVVGDYTRFAVKENEVVTITGIKAAG